VRGKVVRERRKPQRRRGRDEVQNASEESERARERERERVIGVKEGQGWLGRTRVRQHTDGTIREREELGGGYTLGRLVVRGDNMRFLTGRKSDSREAPRPVAPFPLVKSSCISFVASRK